MRHIRLTVCSMLLLTFTAISPIAVAQQKGKNGTEKGGAADKDGKGAADKGAKTAPAGQKGAATTGKKGDPLDVKLNTGDGQIHATYFESTAGKESPAVILLTSTDGPEKKDARNRRIWLPTAQALQKNGFAVITVDLRKHGDSVPPGEDGAAKLKTAMTDYTMMVSADLEAVKAYLLDEHHAEKLNIRKLAIVSMGSSSMVAAAFAVADWAKEPYPDAPSIPQRTPRGQDVQALVMYSPNSNVKGLNLSAITKVLKPLPVAIYIVSSSVNKDDARNAEKIFKAVDLKDEKYKESRKTTSIAKDVHAEGFLEGDYAEASKKDIVDFLTKNVKELPAPWVERIDRRQQ